MRDHASFCAWRNFGRRHIVLFVAALQQGFRRGEPTVTVAVEQLIGRPDKPARKLPSVHSYKIWFDPVATLSTLVEVCEQGMIHAAGSAADEGNI